MDVIRWFPLDRVLELEQAIDAELKSPRHARRRDAIGVALGLCGLRAGEVCRAEQRHFFAAARSLDIPTLKGGRPRKIPLHPSLTAALQAELCGRSISSKFLLCSNRGAQMSKKQPQKLAKQLFDELIGAGHQLTFHSLRHTFAMRLYAETKDLFLVQRMLGHKSVRSTEVYARSLAEIPDNCMVKVGDAVVVRSPAGWPGSQLKLFEEPD